MCIRDSYWPVIPVVDPNGFYTAESKIYQLTEGGDVYKRQEWKGILMLLIHRILRIFLF